MLVGQWSSAVFMHYGQFELMFGVTDRSEDYSQLVDRAITSDGIAQRSGSVVILSPHQVNARMPLLVEQWTAPPPDDLNDWQEAFEAVLPLDGGGLYYNSAGDGSCKVAAVPAGRWQVRITGRGFLQRGWPGSTTPGDRWRVQLWPAAGNQTARRLKTWTPAASTGHVVPQDVETAGLHAIATIVDAVERRRGGGLSGDRAVVIVERPIDASVAKTYATIAKITGWMTHAYIAEPVEVGARYYMTHGDGSPRMEMLRGGFISGHYRVIEPRRIFEMTWSWYRSGGGWQVEEGDPRRVPPWPTLVTFTVSASPDTIGAVVQLTHADVPAEWTTEVSEFWRWNLHHLAAVTTR